MLFFPGDHVPELAFSVAGSVAVLEFAKPGNGTVSLGLAELSSDITVSPPVLMAGSVILTLPIVLLFFAVERYLRGGLVLGSEKG